MSRLSFVCRAERQADEPVFRPFHPARARTEPPGPSRFPAPAASARPRSTKEAPHFLPPCFPLTRCRDPRPVTITMTSGMAERVGSRSHQAESRAAPRYAARGSRADRGRWWRRHSRPREADAPANPTQKSRQRRVTVYAWWSCAFHRRIPTDVAPVKGIVRTCAVARTGTPSRSASDCCAAPT